MILTYILIGIIAVIILWLIGAYNGFIKLVIKAKEAWSTVLVRRKCWKTFSSLVFIDSINSISSVATQAIASSVQSSSSSSWGGSSGSSGGGSSGGDGGGGGGGSW